MAHALDIELLLRWGHLRSHCAEDASATRCTTCGCDLVPLTDSGFGCPACLGARQPCGHACRRCGEPVPSEGPRACKSMDAYRAGRPRHLRLEGAPAPTWAPDPSQTPRPAFAPDRPLVEVAWNQGASRCIIELDRLPRWIAAGVLPRHSVVRVEGSMEAHPLDQMPGCENGFPDEQLMDRARIDGLIEPDAWPQAGHALLRATERSPTIEVTIPPPEPDLSELDPSLHGETRRFPSRLVDLIEKPDPPPGPERDLGAVFSKAVHDERGGFANGVCAVVVTILGAAVRQATWTLRGAILSRWYGERRIQEARRALDASRTRSAHLGACLATVHAARQAVEAEHAIVDAHLATGVARMMARRRELSELLQPASPAADPGAIAAPTARELEDLRGFRIEEARIAGIGERRRAALVTAGLLTAADLQPIRLEGVPSIGSRQAHALLQWRAACLKELRGNASDRTPDSASSDRDLRPVIEAAIDLQAARLHVLHCHASGVLRIGEKVRTLEETLARASAFRVSGTTS